MVVFWLIALLICVGGTAFASRKAVTSALLVAEAIQVSPAIVGLTVMSIGTDLPEIANSIVSSLSGHGDINVGDSVGSAATQITLVLGLLGIMLGPLELPNGNIGRTGIFTVVALAVLATLLSDGRFGRIDALAMLALWSIGSVAIYRRAGKYHQLTLPESPGKRAPLILRLMASFAGLALAATLALWAIVALAERFDAPEFLVGFFLASLGTSLPELVFDVTAIRRGSVALAIGDVVGSTFIDSTASVAIGPLIAPTDVTQDLVVRGMVISLIAIGFVTFVLSRVKEHDWRTGAILLFTYAAFFVIML